MINCPECTAMEKKMKEHEAKGHKMNDKETPQENRGEKKMSSKMMAMERIK